MPNLVFLRLAGARPRIREIVTPGVYCLPFFLLFDVAYRVIKHSDFCCFECVTYVALTLCFKLRSFLH